MLPSLILTAALVIGQPAGGTVANPLLEPPPAVSQKPAGTSPPAVASPLLEPPPAVSGSPVAGKPPEPPKVVVPPAAVVPAVALPTELPPLGPALTSPAVPTVPAPPAPSTYKLPVTEVQHLPVANDGLKPIAPPLPVDRVVNAAIPVVHRVQEPPALEPIAPAAPVVVQAPLLPPPAAPVAAAAAPAPAAAADRWLFMKAVQGTWEGDVLVGNRLNVYGWTEGSYTYGSQGRSPWPMLAQSPTNEFLGNQNWLVFERTVVTSGTTEPTFGFHTAWILPGTDARYTTSRYLLDHQHGVGDLTQSAYPIDLFHAYAEAYFPTIGRGLDIKIGKNAVSYFVETEDKIYNPLFSHSYIFYYCGPFTHTGVQANLKVTDEWAVEARVTTGSDITFGPGEQATFVGSLSWTQAYGGRNTVLLSVVAGSGRFDQVHGQTNLNMVDVVYTHTFNPVLKYTLDSSFGYEANNPDPVNGTGTWFGAAQYLTYTLTPRLSTTGRVEVFDDPQGLRTGFRGMYAAATGGVTFKPRKGLWFRPEIRYDYNTESRPFNGHRDLFTVAADVILRW